METIKNWRIVSFIVFRRFVRDARKNSFCKIKKLVRKLIKLLKIV